MLTIVSSVKGEVSDSGIQDFNRCVLADNQVAMIAEQPTYFACVVVVVDTQD
jgi:hypothetical protein